MWNRPYGSIFMVAMYSRTDWVPYHVTVSVTHREKRHRHTSEQIARAGAFSEEVTEAWVVVTVVIASDAGAGAAMTDMMAIPPRARTLR